MLSGLLKFVLGFFLAIAVLLGSGMTIAIYFINRTAITPEKPMFANDNPDPKPNLPKVTPKKVVKVKPKPTATPELNRESPTALPPGSYTAVVTWSQGLSVRDKPAFEGQAIGGVAGNQKVIILETSQDGKWQKIRIPDTDQEGWVKAGNTEKSN
ncbi:SH3 domain-containing protein [Cylindrospermopsis raciborskii CHAB3438]|uniref:SH3 domain-containing protein n=1 Tax=Cylindrospermopsis raciborskii TaxID=77022 RepID=UPI001F100E72|nr:SH3 domain-containing protein [Cylindrospermopsis raciborskii]MCH4903972.1 SH3 domain-containing protein [Cylindrospermopsis raciborskii CHAB3438]